MLLELDSIAWSQVAGRFRLCPFTFWMLFLKLSRTASTTRISPSSINLLFTGNPRVTTLDYGRNRCVLHPIEPKKLNPCFNLFGRNSLLVRSYSDSKHIDPKSLSNPDPIASKAEAATEGEISNDPPFPGPISASASSAFTLNKSPTFDTALTTVIGLTLGNCTLIPCY